MTPKRTDNWSRFAGEAVAAAVFAAATASVEGRAPLPAHMQPVLVDSGVQANRTAAPQSVFRQVVDLGPEVPWARVLFDRNGTHLPPGSVIRVTSMLDGETHILDADELEKWGYGTAFFNGSQFEVELIAGPNTLNSALRIREVFAGQRPVPIAVAGTQGAPVEGGIAAICGDKDNRVPLGDGTQATAIGRLLPGGINSSEAPGGYCTAFIIGRPSGSANPDKLHLTAGHCFGNPERVKFPNSPIPDNNATPISNTIKLSGKGTVQDVDVGLNINHTAVGDLIVTLEHAGTTVTLINRPVDPASPSDPGSCFADNYDIIISDKGTGGDIDTTCEDNLTSWPAGQPFRKFKPSQALNAFKGKPRSGDWTISVSDNAPLHIGTFVAWRLWVEGAEWNQDLPDDYVLQFNVYCVTGAEPTCSNADCTIHHPPVADQFPVRKDKVISRNGGKGNDWAVFRCGRNNQNQTTGQRQSVLNLASSVPPAGTDVRVTGYGTDGTPTNNAAGGNDASCTCLNPNGTRNATSQTATGKLHPSSEYVIKHDADTCGGNSGSPIIKRFDPGGGQVIGIHTWGDIRCPDPVHNYYNGGTAVTNPSLGDAIRTIAGDGIPAVSEWGLVALTLVLLAAGTIVLRRKDVIAS